MRVQEPSTLTDKPTWSVVDAVRALPAAEWDALTSDDDPFLEHAFLVALEDSRSVGEGTGWLPRIVVARAAGRLVGAVPLWLKDDSYGEFIFDWAWASGAHRAGLPYYPKLVAAVPFTPATGPRLLVAGGADRQAVVAALLEGVSAVADEEGASSVHVLFCTDEEAEKLAGRGYQHRLSMQFHWENRRPVPYRDFEDFLSAFRSRNRKQVRKERALAAAQGLELTTVEGPSLTPRHWEALARLYRANADKHGAHTYLTPAFFELARATLAPRIVATLALRGPEVVAGALNFERGRHLYGRYWGAFEEAPMLHFELCYYRLIERAIARGHLRFEAGAQGEHKLKRGLAPAFTHSAHWVRHPDLAQAVARFIAVEAQAVRQAVAGYEALSPFRNDEEAAPTG